MKKLILLIFVLSSTVLGQNGMVSLPTTPAPTSGQVFTSDGLGGAAFQTPGVTPPTPGYQPNQPLIGCGVQYISGLSFTVSPCTYTIGGATYTSPITTLTSDAADASNPRIDSIIACADAISPCVGPNTVIILKGTAATPDSVPVPNPATQIEITHYEILALATTPNNVTATTIYDENTEWTCSGSGTVACGSTTNPYHLTKDITITNGALNDSFTLVKPAAGTVDLATVNYLVVFIQSLGTWPTGGGGSNAARSLTLQWLNGSTQKGNSVVINTGVFGFDSSITSSYQMLAIPSSLFNINGVPVTTLKCIISGKSGTSTISLRLDFITLQSGFGSTPLPTTLMNFKGTWNNTSAYNINDVVVNSNGIGFIALVANTNVALSTTATWQPLGSIIGTITGSVGDCSGSSTINANATAYTGTLKTAGTITGWDITALASGGGAPGTVTFKTWCVNGGTAAPNSGNSINTSGVSLSSGTYVSSSTVSDFSVTRAAGDHCAISFTAVGTAVCATANVYYNKLP